MSPDYQQKYNERLAALEGIYAPQIQSLQQQISTLPQMYEAQKSSLQQAKENAFRDITKTAARGGMFFTGFTPREQARYLGEKYLPGLQTLSQQELAARQGLLSQIAGLQGQQKAAGLSYLDILDRWQRADEQAAAAAARAGSGAGGFSINLGGGGGGDLTGGAGTTAYTGLSDQTKANIGNDVGQLFATAKSTNNMKLIQDSLTSIKTQLQKTNLSTEARDRLGAQLEAFNSAAKATGIDLNKLQPSRAQSIATNKYVQTAQATAPYLNPIYSAVKGAQAGWNWIFGGR